MSAILEKEVMGALRRVTDPESGRDVVTEGLVSNVSVQDGRVALVLTIDLKDKERLAPLREACERAVAALPGVAQATVVLTAQRKEESGAQSPESRRPAVWNLTPIEGVRSVIAVASGKGGVGKSTTAVNLALALASLGRKTGLLDADIYGPSLPRMLGLSGRPEIAGGKMQPLEAHGVACMSLGFITGEAAILRGPMITKALQQMLRGTAWGELDYLLVDMPPGTGDIHLTMAQQVPLTGAIIVTTPQPVATMDARKCLITFRKLGVPVLGVVENMSYFVEPSSGNKLHLFGEGGGRALAEEMGVAFLGEVPLEQGIREAGDGGKAYQGAMLDLYRTIARRFP